MHRSAVCLPAAKEPGMRSLPTQDRCVCSWIVALMILYPFGAVFYVVLRPDYGIGDFIDLVSFPEYWAGLVILGLLGGCIAAAVNGLNKIFNRKG